MAIGAAGVILCGCGSSSSSSGSGAKPSKAAFCGDNAKLNKSTASANSASSAIKALKTNEATIQAFGRDAPSAISAQAQVLVNGAMAAIKANSPAPLANPKFQAAGEAVDKFCGQK
jgi:hypothetical protein